MPKRSDYDSPWKDLVEKYFQQFMEFFFSHIAVNIDWKKGYEFLDKEFQKIAVTSKTGRRYADKLVKVNELDGRETWVLIHLEIQGQKDAEMAKRMFVYHYRIFDRYQKQIASLALLTDAGNDWRPDEYGHALWGCEVKFCFPVAKILDFACQTEDLEDSRNPFAIAVFAHLKAMETQKNSPKRLEFKKYVTRALYMAHYDHKTILELFRFIDWIMILPEEFESDYIESLTELEEEQNMRYVTCIERRGLEKGLEKGREEGLEKGIEQGIAAHKLSLNTILQSRFDQVSDATIAAIEKVRDLETLKNLVIKSALAESIDAFEDYLKTTLKSTSKSAPKNVVSEPVAKYKTTKSAKPAHRKPKA